jgi:membrane protease YdiL (CAAX protease family)
VTEPNPTQPNTPLSSPHDGNASSPWKRFCDRGGFWKAVLLAAVYYGLYQLVAVGVFFALGELGGPVGSPLNVLITTALPILLGGVLLVLFGWSIGWLRELFGPQPIRGGAWMWIAVAVVLLTNLARFAALDYTEAGFAIVAAWLFAGLCIGFAEELLTRGFVVNLMRRHGYSEILVAVASAGIFAALHIGNAFGGQPIFTTALQVGYTFAFGILMYLALRVTGNIIWPILLHATTDPSTFLLTEYPASGGLAPLAGLGNMVVIATGLVLLIFIRGRVAPKNDLIGEPLPA